MLKKRLGEKEPDFLGPYAKRGKVIEVDKGLLVAVAKQATGYNCHLIYKYVDSYRDACSQGRLPQSEFWRLKILRLLLAMGSGKLDT